MSVERITVFVAGGSGTIGRPLVRACVAAGYRVVATTRSSSKREQVASLGATPLVVDALDAVALERAVREACPTHIIHQLTALPAVGPRRDADLDATNRLREEGTRNLLRAALAAGARRIVVGSFAPAAASGIAEGGVIGRAARAVQSMEAQTLAAAQSGAVEAVILRYGLFYGAGTMSTERMLELVRRRRLPTLRSDRGRLPYVHIDDAVVATVLALTRGTSGGVYQIVDDQAVSFSEMVREMAVLTGAPRPVSIPQWLFRVAEPYLARMLTFDRPMSNADARRDLGWSPTFPSYREGLAAAVGQRRPVRPE